MGEELFGERVFRHFVDNMGRGDKDIILQVRLGF